MLLLCPPVPVGDGALVVVVRILMFVHLQEQAHKLVPVHHLLAMLPLKLALVPGLVLMELVALLVRVFPAVYRMIIPVPRVRAVF